MVRTCARAAQIGLATIIFTEHLEFSPWKAAPEDCLEHLRPQIDEDGLMRPVPIDFEGYYQSIER